MWGLKKKKNIIFKKIDIEHEKLFNANTHQEMQIRSTVGQQTPPRARLCVKSGIAKVREYLRLWGLGNPGWRVNWCHGFAEESGLSMEVTSCDSQLFSGQKCVHVFA